MYCKWPEPYAYVPMWRTTCVHVRGSSSAFSFIMQCSSCTVSMPTMQGNAMPYVAIIILLTFNLWNVFILTFISSVLNTSVGWVRAHLDVIIIPISAMSLTLSAAVGVGHSHSPAACTQPHCHDITLIANQ